jgi:UDP-N-acetylglucosamine 2-epimerase
MSEVFFRELHIPEPDFNLGVGSGSHAGQTGNMLMQIEKILISHKPDMTLVYGDTNSTLAGALASTKLHIPVAHVEAGVRSFNRAMPEEINRIVTDRIANLLFAPTQTAVSNLDHEGLSDITRFTGDVMYDSVLYYQSCIQENPDQYKTEGIPSKYLLATIHRAENTDHPANLLNIFRAFSKLDIPIVLPIHPRTRKTLRNLMELPANVYIIDPVGYLQMMKLTMDSVKVLTDSGGLQKEAYFLNKQCITLRTETEWVETLHDQWNIITASDSSRIESAAKSPLPVAPRQYGFGDGHSVNKILDALVSF